jgi:hypothetical protein
LSNILFFFAIYEPEALLDASPMFRRSISPILSQDTAMLKGESWLKGVLNLS